jgi:hypothetical protein
MHSLDNWHPPAGHHRRSELRSPRKQPPDKLTAGADGITVLTSEKGCAMADLLRSLWSDDQGQDIAEYAVMLAVILVLVVGTIRLV